MRIGRRGSLVGLIQAKQGPYTREIGTLQSPETDLPGRVFGGTVGKHDTRKQQRAGSGNSIENWGLKVERRHNKQARDMQSLIAWRTDMGRGVQAGGVFMLLKRM